MIKALGEDTDFILLVRRPNKDDGLKNTDNFLSDSAYKALKDRLPLDQWSFMVLNYDGKNFDMCNSLKNDKMRSSLYVADFFIVNCDVADEKIDQEGVFNVNQLLGYVLRNLVKTVEQLDSIYIRSFQKSFEMIQQDVRQGLISARSLYMSHDSHSKFVDYLSKFMHQLANEMEQLRNDLQKTTTPQQDDPFQKGIQASIQQCRSELERYRKDEAGLFVAQVKDYFNMKRSVVGTHDYFMHQIRTNALSHFHEIDLGLRLSLGEKKERICKILRSLNLNSLVNSVPGDKNFLHELSLFIPAELSSLKRGFMFLSCFELQYKGFLQSIVWGHLSRFLPVNGIHPAEFFVSNDQFFYEFLFSILQEMPINVIVDKLLEQDQMLLRKIPDGIDSGVLANLLDNSVVQSALQGISLDNLSSEMIRTLIEPLVHSDFQGRVSVMYVNSDSPFNADQIKSSLLQRYELAIDACEKALGRLLPTPAQVSGSMIGEFIDHILSSKDVDIEWNKLLGKDDHRLRVWPELNDIENKKESLKRWRSLLESAESINQTLSNFI
jgi:hypothetical protein